MSGMSSRSTGPVFTPTGPTSTSRRTRSGDLVASSAAIQPPMRAADHVHLVAARADPAVPDGCRRCRRSASIQSGRLERPKPGCDGAISRCRADSRRHVRDAPGAKPLRAVQEQDRRAFAGLEQFELDAGDGNDVPLQGTSSCSLHHSRTCMVGHLAGTVTGEEDHACHMKVRRRPERGRGMSRLALSSPSAITTGCARWSTAACRSTASIRCSCCWSRRRSSSAPSATPTSTSANCR